jgi:hypothetical protein
LSLLEVKSGGSDRGQDGTILLSVDQKVDSLDQKVEKVDRRVEGLELREHGHDQRFGALDEKVTGLGEKFDRLDRRMDYSDKRFDKLFLWVIGIQMTTLIALMAGLFGIVAKLT